MREEESNEASTVELAVLVTSPQFQRRGVGTKLLEYGLREADAAGVQTVLVASQAGEPLYKSQGFVEYEVISLTLSEYEGGEGKGIVRQVIMNRPARSPATTEV
jgi:N-acetylglutamate synthase-like GNAT family acetyltransferase